MQVWDSVKVEATGEAGVVQKLEGGKGDKIAVTVKLDLEDDVKKFDISELKQL